MVPLLEAVLLYSTYDTHTRRDIPDFHLDVTRAISSCEQRHTYRADRRTEKGVVESYRICVSSRPWG